MTIVSCRECKKEVSSEAKVCPHCGAKKPVPKSGIRLWHVLIALPVIGLFGQGYQKSHQSERKPVAVDVSRPGCQTKKSDGTMAVRGCDLPTLCVEYDASGQLAADKFYSLKQSHLADERTPSDVGEQITAGHRKDWEDARNKHEQVGYKLVEYRRDDIKKACPLFDLNRLLEEPKEAPLPVTQNIAAQATFAAGECEKPPLELFEMGVSFSQAEFSTLVAKNCNGASATKWGASLIWSGDTYMVKLSRGDGGRLKVDSISKQ